jgi:hypothetical protein
VAETIRKQRNLIGQLRVTDDPDASVLIQNELEVLAPQKRQMEADQVQLETWRETWCLAQDQLEKIDAWCRNVAANLRAITCEERRLALRAPGVEARVMV